MKEIVVIGAGKIGGAIALMLAETGDYKVIVADRSQEQLAKMENLRGPQMGIDFGSQIRSYVLQPYRIAKDHRTKVEVGDVDKVLDGYLEPFLRGYLLVKRHGTAIAAAGEDELDV